MTDKIIAALEAEKAKVLSDKAEYGWTAKDTAWHRAFGKLAGINYALSLLRNDDTDRAFREANRMQI